MAHDHSNEGTHGFLHGDHWNNSIIGYWFPQSTSEYDQNASDYGIGELSNSFSGLDNDAQAFFLYIFGMFSSVSGLTFVEQSEGEIQIGYTHATNAAHAYFPSATGSEAGDIWFNERTYFNEFRIGQFSGFVVMHELGHALGLEHTHEIPGFALNMDHMSYSVMSYNSTANSTSSGYTNNTTDYAQSLMPLDILALQARYGINYDHHSDDTTYTFNQSTGAMSINGVAQMDGAGDTIFRTIWDGDGEDLINLSNFEDNMDIDLGSGGYLNFSQDQLAVLTGDGETATANVYLAIDPDGSSESLIENIITGSGNDTILGNSTGNNIHSGAGNDIVSGKEGDDVLNGGAGDDVLRGGHGDDVLLGGDGDNILVGGIGRDSFVFQDNEDSHTIIRDFDADMDSLVLENSMDLESAEFTYGAGYTVVTIGDMTITIMNDSGIDIDSFTLMSENNISLLI